jgi:hypothetical protein
MKTRTLAFDVFCTSSIANPCFEPLAIPPALPATTQNLFIGWFVFTCSLKCVIETSF